MQAGVHAGVRMQLERPACGWSPITRSDLMLFDATLRGLTDEGVSSEHGFDEPHPIASKSVRAAPLLRGRGVLSAATSALTHRLPMCTPPRDLAISLFGDRIM